MATGRGCGLVEKCTDLLSEYLEGRRDIERIVFKDNRNNFQRYK